MSNRVQGTIINNISPCFTTVRKHRFTPRSLLFCSLYSLRTFIYAHIIRIPTYNDCVIIYDCFLLDRVWFNSYHYQIGMERNDISKASEVVVGDRELLQNKIAAIRSAGSHKLQVFVLCLALLSELFKNQIIFDF